MTTDKAPQKKDCIACFSSIDARSRRCPHCRTLQGRTARILLHPVVLVALGIWLAAGPALLSIAGVFVLTDMMVQEPVVESLYVRGADFTDYRDQVAMVESEISFNDREKGKAILVIGTLRNESSVSWQDLQLQVSFFDAEGKLIDVGQNFLYSYVLPADAECPFKLSVPQEWPAGKYASHEVTVISAIERVASDAAPPPFDWR